MRVTVSSVGYWLESVFPAASWVKVHVCPSASVVAVRRSFAEYVYLVVAPLGLVTVERLSLVRLSCRGNAISGSIDGRALERYCSPCRAAHSLSLATFVPGGTGRPSTNDFANTKRRW